MFATAIAKFDDDRKVVRICVELQPYNEMEHDALAILQKHAKPLTVALREESNRFYADLDFALAEVIQTEPLEPVEVPPGVKEEKASFMEKLLGQ